MVSLSIGLNTGVPLTLTEKQTLTSPDYVIVFQNDNTYDKVMCVITDTSTFPTRINTFNITVQSSPNWLNGEVYLQDYGFYHYYVYEVADASLLTYATVMAADIDTYVPTYFTSLLEVGKMKYLTSDDVLKYFIRTRPSIKAYNI
jgi:hypothetical protein